MSQGVKYQLNFGNINTNILLKILKDCSEYCLALCMTAKLVNETVNLLGSY